MKEEFITYEQAAALKECGFNWECNHYYTPENTTNGYQWFTSGDEQNYNEHGLTLTTSAPTQALAQKWLREVKDWHIQVRINGIRDMFSVEIWEMKTNGYVKRLEQGDGHVRLFDTYESALSAGIDAALELISRNNGL